MVFPLLARTQNVGDSIRVSLITCSPGHEVYELYGHTALRVENLTSGEDVVFNYGIFSFSQPNFVWRFVRGECDYIVMGANWDYFPAEYVERGSSITAQVLNLTRDEANRLYRNLLKNCLPENRTYRYNFLYNNCTTMVRDMIERSIDGRIAYPPLPEKLTYRQILHQYAPRGSWEAEGNDFLLGAAVDTVVTDRAAMFAPEYMMRMAGEAQVYATDGSLRPLVAETITLLEPRETKKPEMFPLPALIVGLLLLAFNLLVGLLEYKTGWMWWLWDVVLLLVQGAVGVLLAFMHFFSVHPAVDSNWLLWPFSPLALVGIPLVVGASVRHRKTWWHVFHTVYLTLFIFFIPWIPQQFGRIVVPLALALLARPLSYLIHYNKKGEVTNLTTQRLRLLTSLLILMSAAGTDAQTAPEVPRLVVNIVIDQLRTDYLEAFSPLYSERGFMRLMKEGRVYTQAEYPFKDPDRAAAVACLMSGTSPYENGIVGERWLDRQTLTPLYCVDDKEFQGQSTKDASSARNLGVSTITDELKVATEGLGLVYAIAPFRDAAVLLAGHAADGAFWIDGESGQWCSSSYYGAFPGWATTYNNTESVKQRIGKLEWEPLNELVGKYNYFVSGAAKKPFKHKFAGDRKFAQFIASALVNEETNAFMREVIKNTQVGLDDVTDILNIAYYAGNFDHNSVSQSPIELQDTYVRLDRDLGDLFEYLEKRVGEDHVLFTITGTGSAEEDKMADLSKYRVPTGTFSITKAKLLLNMYLIAVYGPGEYVETCLGNELYLNLKLIENRNLNLTEILERSSDFLIQLSGVRDVFTSQRLASGAGTPGIARLRNAYHPKCSGDILIQVSPGWTLVNENTHEQCIARESYVGFPLFFMGCNIEPDTVSTPVTIDYVAPTLAKSMRIRAPNACELAPLPAFK